MPKHNPQRDLTLADIERIERFEPGQFALRRFAESGRQWVGLRITVWLSDHDLAKPKTRVVYTEAGRLYVVHNGKPVWLDAAAARALLDVELDS